MVLVDNGPRAVWLLWDLYTSILVVSSDVQYWGQSCFSCFPGVSRSELETPQFSEQSFSGHRAQYSNQIMLPLTFVVIRPMSLWVCRAY